MENFEEIEQEENTSNSESLFAGFFRRGIAAFLDLFLLVIIFLVLGLSFTVSVSWNYTSFSGLVSTITYSQPLNALFFLIVLIIYSTVTESLWGGTLGKLILGVKVVDLQKEKISLGKSFLRNVFTPVDLLVGPVLFLLSKKRQVLGDKVANTVVVRKKLIDLPVSDKSISKLGIAFSVLFIAMLISFFMLTIWTIPKISSLNQAAHATLESVKGASSDDIPNLYETFSPEFRQSVSLQQFKQVLNEPPFSQSLQDLDVNEIRFYDWVFNKNLGIVTGREGDTLAQLQFLKNSAGEWELLRIDLKPGIRDISLFDFLTSD